MSIKTPILPEDIRKGDNIRRETKDIDDKPVAYEYWADRNGVELWPTPNTYFLLNRPVPPVVLPIEPGYYLDRGGDVWKLVEPNRWFCLVDTKYDYCEAKWAPFTRLCPEAEVVAEVLRAVTKEYANASTTVAQDHATIAAKYGVTL